jgi:hypothetical protein
MTEGKGTVGVRVRALAGGALVLGLFAWAPVTVATARPPQAAVAAATLPARLSDAEFWKLQADISEPGGYFQIQDNYTSNEIEVGQLVTALGERKLSGGVYLGVGPEQNFSYIAAIRPAMAFVIDIRRQAVMQHLMFKAMFELSKDRADFISLLFAKPRPKDLDPAAPIQKIWEAYFPVGTDLALAAKTRERVVERLAKTHEFAFTDDERAQLEGVLAAFVQFGPGITTRGTFAGGRGGGNNVTFADLTGWSFDGYGQPQSFLSTDDRFQAVKALHDRNLIVPVSGDFGGPKALRAIGAYLSGRGARVTAFYVSNVEQYLFRDGKAQAFYDNVGALPIGDTSVFIRPYALRRAGSVPLCGIGMFLEQVKAGRVYSNNEATACVF